MSQRETELTARIKKLETRLRATILVMFVIAAWVMLDRGTTARASEDNPVEIVASKITIVDEKGRRRLLLGGEYAKGRISKSAGLYIFDETGTERGGMGTMEDGSAVIALDAPAGVGSPMRDRRQTWCAVVVIRTQMCCLRSVSSCNSFFSLAVSDWTPSRWTLSRIRSICS